MLHILNGDSTAGALRETAVPGEFVVWCDVLHEGPCPAGLTPSDWRERRAQFLADCGWRTVPSCRRRLERMDAAIQHFRDHEEVVIWCEHDLYDQLLLIRLLDWFSQQEIGSTRLGLICLGSHPDLPRFHGLGELSGPQLAGLFGSQQPVPTAQLQLATQAWHAFCSPDPLEIRRLLEGDTGLLPYLDGALWRHLEQFPAVATGLSRTERQILQAVGAGHHTPRAVFRADQQMEERPFMGDATFWMHLDRLVNARAPLLARQADGKFLHQRLDLTDLGRRVLDGKEDWVRLNGLDRWLGGVHLTGAEPPWRWDPATRRLVVLR